MSEGSSSGKVKARENKCSSYKRGGVTTPLRQVLSHSREKWGLRRRDLCPVKLTNAGIWTQASCTTKPPSFLWRHLVLPEKFRETHQELATAQVILLPFHLPDQCLPLLCFFFLEFWLSEVFPTNAESHMFVLSGKITNSYQVLPRDKHSILEPGLSAKTQGKRQDRYNNLNFINEMIKG